MSENKRSLLDEMERIREEQEMSENDPDTPDVPQTPTSSSIENSTSSEKKMRGMRNATPVDHAKAYVEFKKETTKKPNKKRFLRFFKTRD